MHESMKLIQPYFVIHTDYYYKAICARYGILHFYRWTMQGKEEISAVPDGCIDLVFEYGGGIMNARACGFNSGILTLACGFCQVCGHVFLMPLPESW